jgi:hypothetical protein
MITVEVAQRFFSTNGARRAARWTLGLAYLAAFLSLVRAFPVHPVDEIFQGWLPRLYGLLITALFFPLLMIAASGWLRMIMIWGATKRDLLQCLENLPIRFAFNRLNNSGWMNMLRQSGLREQWQDMSRSIESAEQLSNSPAMVRYVSRHSHEAMCEIYHAIMKEGAALRQIIDGKSVDPNTPALIVCPDSGNPNQPSQREGLNRMHAIERRLAEFGEVLLDSVLIPYWAKEKRGLVDSAEIAEKKEGNESKTGAKRRGQALIQEAEEFIVIRYVSLIRAVLVNLRYLMFFVGLTFILTITAWNMYPFQPRQVIDWLFTTLLVMLGTGVIWVLAQMYRDPLLSRITHTKPNELGFEFYVRLASVGALPLLTWLAYQFPDVGGMIFKIFQSGSEVVK